MSTKRARSTASVITTVLVGTAALAAQSAGPAAAATQTVVVEPTADAYTIASDPAKNTGTWKRLSANASYGKTIYLKFSVPATPSGMELTSAVLTTRSSKTQPAAVTLDAVPVTSWNETTITAANAPSVGATVSSLAPAPGATGLTFTVTDAVTPGAVTSFALRSPSGPLSADSRESGTGPQLSLTYTSITAPSNTLYGATLYTGDGSTWQQAYDRASAAYGKLEVIRMYYTGLPGKWPGKASVTTGPVVLSFKARPQEINAGLHDAYFTSWFASIPKDRLVYWNFIHEPENNIDDGEFTATEYRAAFRRLAGLENKADNPNLKATAILMSWSLEPGARRTWSDYYPGNDVIDVLAWDAYNTGGKKSPQYYETPASMFDKLVAVSRSQGKPWGLGEFGSQRISGDSGAGRAAWLKASIEYQRANGALFVTYYDSYGGNTATPEYRLLDDASKSMWRWAVSGS